jgi:hypothetical protein
MDKLSEIVGSILEWYVQNPEEELVPAIERALPGARVDFLEGGIMHVTMPDGTIIEVDPT